MDVQYFRLDLMQAFQCRRALLLATFVPERDLSRPGARCCMNIGLYTVEDPVRDFALFDQISVVYPEEQVIVLTLPNSAVCEFRSCYRSGVRSVRPEPAKHAAMDVVVRTHLALRDLSLSRGFRSHP